MVELIVLQGSVGANGNNFLPDVAKIGAASIALGPNRGGVFAPPLSIGGLAEAIRSFQTLF